jgi:cytochrome b pre-mRNA-processing protein 3
VQLANFVGGVEPVAGLQTPGERTLLGRFFKRDRQSERIAAALYGAIVAQARQPALYADLSVPDSVSGRFEMILLHLVLLSRRLKTAGEEARKAGQEAFDLFCTDMDNSLREMGVGDLAVPKKMREVGEAYFGRSAAYEAGLSTGDVEGLAAAFDRIVYEGRAPAGVSEAMARYSLAGAEELRRQDEAAIMAGGPAFPNPVGFLLAERPA